MQKVIQTSFGAGELSPSMAGRVDLAKYRVGAKTLKNFYVLPQGGAANRPGTKFVAEITDGPARLIPFRFSVVQTYALIFTDYKLKFATKGVDGVGLVEYDTGSLVAVSDGGMPLESSHEGSQTAALAFDNDSLTYWQAANTGGGAVGIEYVGYDFGSAVAIDGFDLWQGVGNGLSTDINYQVDHARLEYSDNGASWTFVQDYVPAGQANATEPQFYTVASSSAHRYWRLLQTGQTLGNIFTQGTQKWSVRELTFYHSNAGEIVEITSPYAFADLVDLKFVQSADVIFFAHPDYPPYRLVRSANDSWAFERISFLTDVPTPANAAAVYNNGGGGSPGRDMLYQISAIDDDGAESLPTSSASATVDSPWKAGATVAVTWDAVASATGYRIYKNSRGYYGFIGAVYKDTARIAPSATLSSGDYSAYSKERAFDGDPDTNWRSTHKTTANNDVSYIGQDCGTEKTVTKVRILQGRHVTTGETAAVMYLQYSSTGVDGSWVTLDTWTVDVSADVWHEFRPATTQSARYWRLLDHTHSVRTGFDGSDRWVVEEVEFHENGVPLTFTDDNINEDASFGPLRDQDPFTMDFPGAVGIFQQRLWYARTDNNPQTLWATRTGLFNSMATSTPLRDDNALEFTVDGREVNAIEHILPLNKLLLFTSGGELFLTSGNRGLDAVTPSSVSIRIQGYRGCANVPPLTVGNNVLFVQRNSSVVREMANVYEDSYDTTDVSVMASHMFRGYTLKEWAYQQDPNSLVWVVRSDGKALSLTYLREQEVWAWTQHDTIGTFESVCSVDFGDGQDEVFFVAKRQRIVATVPVNFYALEILAHRLPDRDVEQGVFLDSALSYDAAPATVFGGLGHLIGLEVSILADGSVLAPQTVAANGTITISPAASVVHVGLPYTSDLCTMRLEYDDKGTAQGRKRKISKVFLRLEDTRAAWIGPDADHLTEMKFRDGENLDAPTILFSGDKRINITPQWGTDGQVFVRQIDPLPITVLAIIPEIETSATA